MPRRARDFEGWLAAGRKLVAELESRREQLRAELAEVEVQLSQVPARLTGAQAPARRFSGRRPGRRARQTRAPRQGGLRETVKLVLSKAGGPMTIREIEQGVLREGYQTTSKYLYNQICDTLRKIGAKRVGPGQHMLKG